MNTLEDRIAKLERRNRFLQCFLVVSFLGVGLMGFNYSPQEEITTRELKILSKTGTVAAIIGSDEDGGLVKIYNDEGDMTAVLMCTKVGSAMALYQDGRQKPAASLSTTNDGGHLSINSNSGESAAAITVLENRGGIVATFNATDGELSWTSPAE